MKLYFSKGACSLAVRILINEIGIPCEFEAVNLQTKQTESGADYYKINAKGSVPALQLDNKEILTENVAIQLYIAETKHATQLFPPPTEPKRYRILEWLAFIATDLHKGCGPLFNPNVPDDLKDKIFRPLLLKKLNLVEDHLAKNKFLMGEKYTLPDGYLFVILRWTPKLKINLSDLPNLNRYVNDLKQHASIKKSLEEEGIT